MKPLGRVNALRCKGERHYVSYTDYYKQGDRLAGLYDIRYNGTLTFSVISGDCPTQSRTTDHVYTLRIGNVRPITGTTLSREMWDDNPFWIGVFIYAPDGREKAGDTYGHLRAGSSSSRYVYSKH